MKDPQALSLARFKRLNGTIKSYEQLDETEKPAFILANGMKECIEILEVSIPNNRVFARAKFNVMQLFHRLHDDLDKFLDELDQPKSGD